MRIEPWRLPEDRDIALAEDWDAEVFDLNAPAWRFQGRVHVAATARRDSGGARVGVTVTAPLRAVCGRCDQPFDASFEKTLKLICPVEEGRRGIELDDVIREEILLSFPAKILCSDSCKGLCARCGADLNKERCRCP